MKNYIEIIVDNIPWVVTTILAVGAFIVTVKYQGEAIANNDRIDEMAHERIYNLEKALVRIDVIREDIKTIKEDIKEIKGIVLKPAISCNKSESSFSTNKDDMTVYAIKF